MARNKYPEETRNLIIDTAARLFIEKGYDNTSIQDIINNLGGLSKGAIYYHFKSKEEIMMAVGDKLYSTSEEEMYEVRSRTDLNGMEKLKELFRLSTANSSQTQMFEAAPDMLTNPQLLTLYLRDSIQKDATELTRKVIEEGVADGSIHTEYPQELAEVLMLLGNFWLNPMIYHCNPEETVRKAKFYQHILKLFELDVIDNSLIDKLEEFAVLYSKKK